MFECGCSLRSEAAAAAARKRTRKAPTPRPATPAPAVTVTTPAQHVIDNWTATRKPAAAVWDTIGDTVRAIVTAAKPGGPDLAMKYMRTVARHVASRHLTGHRIDDWRQLLSDKALAAAFGNDANTGILYKHKCV